MEDPAAAGRQVGIWGRILPSVVIQSQYLLRFYPSDQGDTRFSGVDQKSVPVSGGIRHYTNSGNNRAYCGTGSLKREAALSWLRIPPGTQSSTSPRISITRAAFVFFSGSKVSPRARLVWETSSRLATNSLTSSRRSCGAFTTSEFVSV